MAIPMESARLGICPGPGESPEATLALNRGVNIACLVGLGFFQMHNIFS